MENKIGSFFGQAAQSIGNYIDQVVPPKPGQCPKLDFDSVEHAATDDGGGAIAHPSRLGSTGDKQLDDQLLMSRTGAPEALSKRSATPTMEVAGQYQAGHHESYVLKFDRPVSRTEAEKILFKEGKTPSDLQHPGGDPSVDRRMLLGSVGRDKDGKAREWVLSVPDMPITSYDTLNPGVEDRLMKAPNLIPDWVPAGTREVVATRHIPVPGDPRFAEVKNGFKAPNDQVTVWRDGDTTFRYDAKTGKLEGYRDQRDEGMGGYNRSVRMYMMQHGLSIDAAMSCTSADSAQYVRDSILKLAIGGVA